jgi:hypothetical protein
MQPCQSFSKWLINELCAIFILYLYLSYTEDMLKPYTIYAVAMTVQTYVLYRRHYKLNKMGWL